jgi:hypothetical protein
MMDGHELADPCNARHVIRHSTTKSERVMVDPLRTCCLASIVYAEWTTKCNEYGMTSIVYLRRSKAIKAVERIYPCAPSSS